MPDPFLIEIIDLSQEIFPGLPEVEITVHASHEQWDGITGGRSVSPFIAYGKQAAGFERQEKPAAL